MALFAFALGWVTFVVRIWAPVGWQWEPPHLELAHFPQHIAMFTVGLAAYRGDWLARLGPIGGVVTRRPELGCEKRGIGGKRYGKGAGISACDGGCMRVR
jgi:hypothetical protein